MLKLPGNMTAEKFLARHWQKAALFMPQALQRLRPSVTRNELGWLATLDDVESRLVFTERGGSRLRYRAETGPFDPEYLAALPKRDWTLLVHDVEKHLPAMRRLFAAVPFIPDWRIDDLMVSFAAPGGGVGPHRDNYDVFLCQGIGVRNWQVTADAVPDDADASNDLALTAEFAGHACDASEGDVLYLPPGVAHWGTAHRASITYSIGMRAPQLSDLAAELPDDERRSPFYLDPDLRVDEAKPGYISRRSLQRVKTLLGTNGGDDGALANALGRFATETKDWITPARPTTEELEAALAACHEGTPLQVHGMARIAFDDRSVYVNGRARDLPAGMLDLVGDICASRRLAGGIRGDQEVLDCLSWMAEMGAFELPEHL
jgi:50S ribosomal protein L16 3-hydroxylase